MRTAQESASPTDRHAWLAPPEEVDEASPGRVRRRVLHSAAVGIVALVALLALWLVAAPGHEALGWTTIAVGPSIVRWVEIALALLVVAVVLVVIARRTGTAPGPRHRAWRTWVGWSTAIVGVLSMVGITLTVAQDHYTLLGETSASGCRVVVHDESGQVGIARPGISQVTWLGALELHGVAVAHSAHVVTLTWDGDVGTISHDGEGGQTGGVITYESAPIVCEAG